MPRRSSRNAARKFRGRGRGCMEDPAPTPLPSRSPSDGEDAASNVSRASSVAASVASTSSQPTGAKKRAKKTQYCLAVEEEQQMLEFLTENAILWDIKKTDYRRVDKKGKLWADQAKDMGKSVEHLQGWFKSLRDTHTRLHKKRSGDGAQELTEREQWVKAKFGFLTTVIRHRPEPVHSVKETIAAHSGDLEAGEAACAEMVVLDDSTPSPVPRGKRAQEDEQLQSINRRVQETGEILRNLAQPQAITPTLAFANYVRDTLASIPDEIFQESRLRITNMFTELLTPISVQSASAPATYTPTASRFQQGTHSWRHTAPAASVSGQYMQQPQYQQVMGQFNIMPPAPQHVYQFPPPPPPPLMTQQPIIASSSAAVGSTDQVLSKSQSTLDNTEMFNLSAFSFSSGPNAASSPRGELSTLPPSEESAE